ncbi:YciI family protein [Staphylococcus simiae]|uniref:YCII-related domain-containing protein n=1 Tax=Staphylococcus simiae CCM 7213 = CCUG 51256 TaxID=911238 RepID=G5JKE9_9STAP|nr:YciI family protein [Staphylococcus simiae]EHJ07320.1 hypothetical protein SS7213T_09804 [Staphylococcus simiae CCM 7213 = CCUG 51256]PNZ12015.1 hypothetical protein CD113_07665 [Staphylococcus simiae]SNV83124.1 YciI-like protein [Staphylococcus simiae]
MTNYYIVKFVHTDLLGWQEHLEAHVKYLYQLTTKGYLAISGPIENEDEQRKEAYLILKADNEQKLQTLLENDPYWYEGLVAEYTVEEWKPMFGDLNNLTINRPF